MLNYSGHMMKEGMKSGETTHPLKGKGRKAVQKGSRGQEWWSGGKICDRWLGSQAKALSSN